VPLLRSAVKRGCGYMVEFRFLGVSLSALQMLTSWIYNERGLRLLSSLDILMGNVKECELETPMKGNSETHLPCVLRQQKDF
jgi:hypothetical protein